MKSNKEILDWFGENIISRLYDPNMKLLKETIYSKLKGHLAQDINEIYDKLTLPEKERLLEFHQRLLGGFLFEFLNFFEDDDEFSIIYTEGNRDVRVAKLSEMLKAELLNEDGWIARFSKEKHKED